MKKIICFLLVATLLFNLGVTCGYAESISNQRFNFQGEVIHQEMVKVSQENQLLSRDGTYSKEVLSTTSAKENADGSFTTFQYLGNRLTDEHTTVPGSGVVKHTFYKPNGEVHRYTEKLSSSSSPNSVEPFGFPDWESKRQMGNIYYKSLTTGVTYSINVKINEEYYKNKVFRFGKGTAKTLAEWTSKILSTWLFIADGISIAKKIIFDIIKDKVLSQTTNALYTVLITRDVVCDYSNQIFYGNATSPSKNYPEGRLEGTYAVVNNNGKKKIIREGFTVSNWRQDTFGRLLMYQVFGIDESPTYWVDAK
ncbi:hypothetical protein [Guggenheimella bovis]